ncbi:MAG: hypothetical protein NVSMB2_03450 [Chloroflexota bacterium]
MPVPTIDVIVAGSTKHLEGRVNVQRSREQDMEVGRHVRYATGANGGSRVSRVRSGVMNSSGGSGDAPTVVAPREPVTDIASIVRASTPGLLAAERTSDAVITTGHIPTTTAQNAWAPFVATLPFLPLAAAVWTVVIYVAPARMLTGDGAVVGFSNLLVSPLIGLKAHLLLSSALAALLSGLAAAAVSFFVLQATSAQRANVRMFGELCGRLRVLAVRVQSGLNDAAVTPAQRQACAEAAALHVLACTELNQPGLRWALGSGYIAVWKLVHGAEEIMVTLATPPELVGMAVMDELRLHKSDIANRELLVTLVRKGVQAIDPRLLWFLQDPETPLILPHAAPAPESGVQVLRSVKTAMHQYRDAQWSALVRIRNHLLATFAMAGTLAYLAVVLAVSSRRVDTPEDLGADPIVGGAALFLVGAMVGLIPRLRGYGQPELSVEDYGLARAHLNLTPLLSGLAALGGVLVVDLIPGFQAIILSIVPIGEPRPVPSLTGMLTLNTNSLALMLAAIFGLTPNLLLTLLQRGADRLQQSLLSTTASQTSLEKERPAKGGLPAANGVQSRQPSQSGVSPRLQDS